MSNNRESIVLRELRELRSLESQLESKWRTVKRADSGTLHSFLASLIDLDVRAKRLERLLDASSPL